MNESMHIFAVGYRKGNLIMEHPISFSFNNWEPSTIKNHHYVWLMMARAIELPLGHAYNAILHFVCATWCRLICCDV